MKILFIGGTRLLGKKIVELFVATGHYDITVLSRKADLFSKTCHIINGERSKSLQKIKGQYFDFIFDFIAYKPENVQEVNDNIYFEKYIFISSCWLKKLNYSLELDEFVDEINSGDFQALPDVTKEYLINKQQSELYIRDHISKNKYTILRLPIFFGYQDHTGRLEFYISRLLDNNPVILLDGGENICQIAFVDDIAIEIVKMFNKNRFNNFKILEAIPPQSISVAELLFMIKKIIGSQSEFVKIPVITVTKKLPSYLDQEPLWRESYIPESKSNIFTVMMDDCNPIEFWLKKIIPSIVIGKQSALRSLELELIQEFR